MARSTSGLSTTTLNNFLINSGAIYINLGLPDERLLGATRDGVTFTIEQDVAELEVDGSPGPFLGGRRVIEVRPRIEATILEVTPENLQLALAGSSLGEWTESEVALDPATHTTLTRNRGIQASDYIANVAVVGQMSGSGENFIGLIYNALSDGEFSFETADAGEAGIELSLTGHFDPQNITQEPWEIRIPKEITSITAPIV